MADAPNGRRPEQLPCFLPSRNLGKEEIHRMDDLRLARRSEDALRLADVERQRLFAEEVFSRLHCGEGDFCLERRGNGQSEGVNIRVSHQLAPIFCGFRYAQLPGDFSGVLQREGANSTHFAARHSLKSRDVRLLAETSTHNADGDRTAHQPPGFEKA